MSFVAAAVAAGTVMTVYGQVQAGKAAAQAGQARNVEKQFEAAQYTQQAGQAIAASQRNAIEERRTSRYLQSRALALAAASGAGASDSTITKIIADIAGEGAYRASVALYNGEEQARQLRLEAQSALYTGAVEEIGGEQRQTAYNISAVGSGLSGAANLYEKYGTASNTKASATSNYGPYQGSYRYPS